MNAPTQPSAHPNMHVAVTTCLDNIFDTEDTETIIKFKLRVRRAGQILTRDWKEDAFYELRHAIDLSHDWIKKSISTACNWTDCKAACKEAYKKHKDGGIENSADPPNIFESLDMQYGEDAAQAVYKLTKRYQQKLVQVLDDLKNLFDRRIVEFSSELTTVVMEGEIEIVKMPNLCMFIQETDSTAEISKP